MANPVCPYCNWELGEWADGKKESKEKVECPNCLKKYFYRTFSMRDEWLHLETPLGRKPKNKFT